MDKDTRIDISNRMLQCFAPDTLLRLESGYVIVEWINYKGKQSKRWMTRGQNFYPVWSREWGHGGTACTALAQLIRWVQGKPVLPISSWEYWKSDRCKLLRHGDADDAIQRLLYNGYPQTANCVLCGLRLAYSFDWWSLKKVSGPCCNYTEGCRQNGR